MSVNVSRREPIIVVSFEGPDAYSQAGGLGVRVTGLVNTLAMLEYETHLFFIGDPAMPGEERREGGRLTLHRWGQWISAMSPEGVYADEYGKANDLAGSLPPYLMERLLLPAIERGSTPILLFEEWQTAGAVCRTADALSAHGVRDRAMLLWNANNPYGFERIDWHRLAAAATVTTISRHMRSIIRAHGVDARVVPNGLSDSAFEAVPAHDLARLREAVAQRPGGGLLFKMARWEREKGWTQALDAMVRFRADATSRRRAPVLIARSGGPTGRGGPLVADAEARGLVVRTFDDEESFTTGVGEAVRAGTDVVNLAFGVTPALARTLYAAADGVLANSVSEPFGLVGLEAMASGGVVFTGGTGEDYAVDRRNALVLQTLDSREIMSAWDELMSSPTLAARLRRAARRTARDYAWRIVIARLFDVVSGGAERASLNVGSREIDIPLTRVKETETGVTVDYSRRGTAMPRPIDCARI